MATKKLIRKTPTAATPAPAKQVSKTVSKSPSRPAPEPEEETTSTNGDGEQYSESAIRAGWTAAEETADSTSNYAQAFKLQTKSQLIKFLQDKPYASFRRHWIDRVGIGKRAYTCLQSFGKDCPLCNIGDKPQAVTSFNVAVVGDDGEATLKTWDCGVKVMQVLRGYANDPKIGPLDKPTIYFGVSKTEAKQRQQVQTNVNPVRARDLEEDYGVKPLTSEAIAHLLAKAYDADIVPITKRSEMEEIAAEMINEDTDDGGQQQRGRRSTSWDSDD